MRSVEVAEDIASAVFVRMVEQFDQLKGQETGKVGCWLYGTASNMMASYLLEQRKQHEAAGQLFRWEKHVQAPPTAEPMDWPLLYEAVSKLSPDDQQLLMMRFAEGLETSDIAESLQLNHSTVRSRLSRAVQSLRAQLDESFR